MKNFYKISVIIIITLLITPQITFASWWNPLTWFKKSAPTTQSDSPQKQPTVDELSKKIEVLQKQIDDKNTKQTPVQKTSPKVIQNPPKQTTTSIQSPQTGKLTNKKIIAKVKPATVYISTTNGSGSGMIISTDGYILTNAHVVSDQATVTVTLSTGSIFDGVVVGRDEKIDLAIIKVTGYSLPVVEFGNSDIVEQGDDVFTLGYPFGLKGDVSFKEGTISRKIFSEDGIYLETSAEIHPGNSGGPLVDSYGRAVGINTASLGQNIKGITVGETIKFAIPINVAKNLIPELKVGRQVILPKTATPITGNPFQAEDTISKCYADAKTVYNNYWNNITSALLSIELANGGWGKLATGGQNSMSTSEPTIVRNLNQAKNYLIQVTPLPFQTTESFGLKNILVSAIDDFYSAIGLMREVVYGYIGPDTTKESQTKKVEQANSFYWSFNKKIGEYLSLSKTMTQMNEKAVMEYCNKR